MHINVTDGTQEVIIRQGEAPKAIDPKPPVITNITGTLPSVLEYLTKRVNTGQFEQSKCAILVNREALTIQLVINEDDTYKRGTVTGKLEQFPKFKEFGINANKKWSPSELGKFIKMNRSFFESKEVAMKLTTTLMNFTATINQKIECAASEKGDKTDNFNQVVNSNLPEGFKVKMSVFKGYETFVFDVETIAEPNGKEIYFTLISPAANDVLEETRDNAINEQLDKIKEVSPNIVIIEQ